MYGVGTNGIAVILTARCNRLAIFWLPIKSTDSQACKINHKEDGISIVGNGNSEQKLWKYSFNQLWEDQIYKHGIGPSSHNSNPVISFDGRVITQIKWNRNLKSKKSLFSSTESSLEGELMMVFFLGRFHWHWGEGIVTGTMRGSEEASAEITTAWQHHEYTMTGTGLCIKLKCLFCTYGWVFVFVYSWVIEISRQCMSICSMWSMYTLASLFGHIWSMSACLREGLRHRTMWDVCMCVCLSQRISTHSLFLFYSSQIHSYILEVQWVKN